MTLDDLLQHVAREPPRTVEVPTTVLAPGRLEEARRPGGMLLTDLFAGATRGAPRMVQYGHILGPPAPAEALDAWGKRFPNHQLPADLRALVARVNGIHLWADIESGRSYEGLAPIEEWDLARVKMYGEDGDPSLLQDRYVAISYHTDASSFMVLDVESGRYFVMDTAGPDESSPIGGSVTELLDWLWSQRIDPGVDTNT